MIDLNEAAKSCEEISLLRMKNGGVGNDALKHCAGEVIEAVHEEHNLLEALDYDGTEDEISKARTALGKELADIIICALIDASENKIDIEFMLREKMAQNAARANRQGDKL